MKVTAEYIFDAVLGPDASQGQLYDSCKDMLEGTSLEDTLTPCLLDNALKTFYLFSVSCYASFPIPHLI